MTSFGWKRKIGEKVSREKSSEFEANAKDVDKETELLIEEGEIDWLTLARRQRSQVLVLEDAVAKSKRLAAEGATLASEERFWEAIKKWNEGIELTPNDEKLYEMKAQAFLQLNELYPALQTAEKVVKLNPRWWVGYQTFGRTLLGLGEVSIAIRNFSKAVHLNPGEAELWEEDLKWACELRKRSSNMQAELNKVQDESNTKIIEITDNTSQDSNISNMHISGDTSKVELYQSNCDHTIISEQHQEHSKRTHDQLESKHGDILTSIFEPGVSSSTLDQESLERPIKKVKHVPINYVQMRK